MSNLQDGPAHQAIPEFMEDALDILICGAGAVGLTAALGLARIGLKVRIIDQHQGITPLSRSVTLHARSLELLDALGVMERLSQEAHRVSEVIIRDESFSEITRLDYGNLNHEYPYFLSCPQPVLEQVLRDALAELGVHVEQETQYKSSKQGELMVTTIVENNEKEEHIHSKIMVAADGEHSSVRQSLKVGSSMDEYVKSWSFADIRSDDNFGDANFCLMNEGLLYVQRIKDDLYRVISDLPNAYQLLPSRIEVDDVMWTQDSRICCHQIRSYQYGRVFFAGGSAHTHSPFDSRGLNMGIEDAITLTAMLADGCVDQYHDNRYRSNALALKEGHVLLNLISADTPMLAKWRDFLLKHWLKRPRVQSKFLAGISGL